MFLWHLRTHPLCCALLLATSALCAPHGVSASFPWLFWTFRDVSQATGLCRAALSRWTRYADGPSYHRACSGISHPRLLHDRVAGGTHWGPRRERAAMANTV